MSDAEGSKTDQTDFLSTRQGTRNVYQYAVHRLGCISLAQIGGTGNTCYEIVLIHVLAPFKILKLY
jgi:hypothetical protein